LEIVRSRRPSSTPPIAPISSAHRRTTPDRLGGSPRRRPLENQLGCAPPAIAEFSVLQGQPVVACAGDCAQDGAFDRRGVVSFLARYTVGINSPNKVHWPRAWDSRTIAVTAGADAWRATWDRARACSAAPAGRRRKGRARGCGTATLGSDGRVGRSRFYSRVRSFCVPALVAI